MTALRYIQRWVFPWVRTSKNAVGRFFIWVFFFRKELDNYNSISIITFSEDLCVGSFFWLFSVPLPPTMRKFQWRLRKGRRPMKQPSWISSRTRWGCGAWVDVDAFWQMFSAEIGTPRLYFPSFFKPQKPNQSHQNAIFTSTLQLGIFPIFHVFKQKIERSTPKTSKDS